MSSAPSVTQWTQLVATQLPHLSRPQATVLALWSLGPGAGPLLWSHRRQRVRGRPARPQGKHGAPATARMVLRGPRQTGCPAPGAPRGSLFCPPCCAGSCTGGRGTSWPWRWMPPPWATGLPCWRAACSTGGCAIPVAWAVLPATTTGGLENRVAALAAPPARHRARDHDGHCPGRPGPVCPLAVSGHCPPGGGIPCYGVNAGGTVSGPGAGARWRLLSSFAPAPGTRWQGTGTAFKTRPLACTLLACWEPGQADRWLLMTDLPPAGQHRGPGMACGPGSSRASSSPNGVAGRGSARA